MLVTVLDSLVILMLFLLPWKKLQSKYKNVLDYNVIVEKMFKAIKLTNLNYYKVHKSQGNTILLKRPPPRTIV